MTQLTVATLNLRGRHDRWLKRRHLIVAEMLDAQPDLISLQEISRPIGQGRWLRNQINSRLGSAAYHVFQKPKAHPWHGLFESVGVLSRLPVLSQDYINLGYGGRVGLRINVELARGQLIDFVATHFHHAAPDREARHEQAMALTGWLGDGAASQWQIVAGDFNEIPTGLAIQYLKQTFRSAMAEWRGGAEPPATYPTALAPRHGSSGACLDYIFLSPTIGPILNARIICKKPPEDDPALFPSDHVGLLATVEIPDR